MSREDDIVKIINTLSGKCSPDRVFSDWVTCMALAIQNRCILLENDLFRKRENEYISIMNRYDHSEQILMCEMYAMLTEILENKIYDVLGAVYMKLGSGSSITGQFFTPYHLSKLTAAVSIPDGISEKNKMIINEPSVGGGGMIIAIAEILKEKGINYQRCMKVVAQDLDYRCIYMSFVQFSLLGIDATLIQGDTLGMKRPGKEQIFRTPMAMGVFL